MARRILFAVHDWGLGHATRSLVLIRALLERGDAVTILMAESPGLALLRTELGDACEFHEYEDLPKPFSRYPAIFYLRMSLAVPRVWLRFELEQRLTGRLVRARRIDTVVSDSSARRLVTRGAELLPLSFAAPDRSWAARTARAPRWAAAASPAERLPRDPRARRRRRRLACRRPRARSRTRLGAGTPRLPRPAVGARRRIGSRGHRLLLLDLRRRAAPYDAGAARARGLAVASRSQRGRTGPAGRRRRRAPDRRCDDSWLPRPAHPGRDARTGTGDRRPLRLYDADGMCRVRQAGAVRPDAGAERAGVPREAPLRARPRVQHRPVCARHCARSPARRRGARASAAARRYGRTALPCTAAVGQPTIHARHKSATIGRLQSHMVPVQTTRKASISVRPSA